MTAPIKPINDRQRVELPLQGYISRINQSPVTRSGLPLIVCMGVSGSGKSTYAQKLASKLGLRFLDADDFHSDANKQKMQAGTPLEDSDREQWMQDIRTRLNQHAEAGSGCVLAHSGLRQQHREQLRNTGLEALFLHLDAPRDIILQRMAAREDHFMPQTLLNSQYDALQSTLNEQDVVRIDVSQDIDSIEKATFEAVYTRLRLSSSAFTE